jgi:hypothetical protein
MSANDPKRTLQRIPARSPSADSPHTEDNNGSAMGKYDFSAVGSRILVAVSDNPASEASHI